MRFTYHLLALASVALAADGVGASSLKEDGGSALAGDGEGVVSLVINPASGSEIAATGLAALPGVQVEHDLTGLGLVRVVATAEAAAALRASGFVAQAVTSHPMEVLLDESIAIVEADIAGAEGADGTGSVIAVIDSGVDTSHPAFSGRVVGEACFLESAGGTCPTGGATSTGEGAAAPCTELPDDCAHGTHVAGIALSAAAPLRGVVPAAGLLAIRVMHIEVTEQAPLPYQFTPEISSLDVLDALNHVLTVAQAGVPVAAVNLSLGGSPALCDDPVDVALWSAVAADLNEAGVAVVTASGNRADEPGPGRETELAFPACIDGFIAVGATERDPTEGFAAGEDPELTSFTQFEGGLDLVAPGIDITSWTPGGESATLTGTSMATPHVAGAFALLRGTQTGWSPDRYAQLLRTSGAMVERSTAEPDDRHDRFPELRLASAMAFEPFADAGNGFWVAAADWAKHTGVSVGIGENRYGPERTLNRAQAVTFLWRVMGEPAAPSGSFPDVPDGVYYTEPVAWAAEERITTGIAGSFLPEDPVTRAQMATFLWRLVGSPEGSSPAGFRDVPDGQYYTDAVDWMAENGITTGTSPTEYSPDDTVTRAQMITFVWRLVNHPAAWSGAVEPPALAMF